jgi:DNA (cytosine-5)-methyltransferase 1
MSARVARSARTKSKRSRSLTAAEFFAGIGLVRLALERQGWRVVFANDIDPDKQEMYERNFGAEHFHLGDIHELDADRLPRCDLFTASFPCNDLSIAGAWAGLNGKESSAFWGLIDILKRLGKRRPPLVMLENVVGFLQAHGGKDFESALLALNASGYVVDAFILNAVHWVPQSRTRLFVIAKHDGDGGRNPYAMESDARPEALFEFINLHQNIRWDIRELPRLPRPRKQLNDILEDLPDDDPHWWDAKRAKYFLNQLSKRHLLAARLMMGQKYYSYGTAFRRVRHGKSMAELRTDGIAGCLRTPRGGSGRQILFKAGRGRYQVRLLTARECARLQGVPDSYRIDVPLNQALFGFGDAVCVPAVEWIAKNYLTPCANALRTAQPSERLFA